MHNFHLLPHKSKDLSAVEIQGPPFIRRLLPKESLETGKNCFCIPSNKALATLKEIAAEGEIFYGEEPLICNFFADTSVYVEATVQGDEAVILAFAQVGKKEILLEEMEYIALCAHPFFVHRGMLRCFHREMDVRLLQWIFRHQICSKKELDKVARDLEEEREYGIVFSQQLQNSPQQQIGKILLQDYFGRFIRLENSSKELERDIIDAGYKKSSDGSYCLESAESIDAIELLVGTGHNVCLSSGKQVCIAQDVMLQTEEVEGKIHVQGRLLVENTSMPVIDALMFAAKERPFFPLPGGKVCLVPRQLQKLGQRLKTKEFRTKGDAISLTPLQALQLPLDAEWTNSLDVKKLFEKKWFAERTLPSRAFLGELRPYQQEGVNWLSFLDRWRLGAILADEMGLGKTVQWIAFLSTILDQGRHLLLAPKSLGNNWVRELKTFLPSCQVQWMEKPEPIDEKVQLVIASYHLFRQNLPLFSSTDFRTATLDEAQNCKNSDTQVVRALQALRAEQKIALTGTPIENNLGDLISLITFVLGAASQEVLPQEPSLLKEIVSPFILRRTKDMVAKELPEKIEKTVFVEMDEGQKELYRKWERKGLHILADHKEKQSAVFEVLLRLRQLSLSPLLIEQYLDREDTRESAKVDYLLEHMPLLLEEGKKVLLFSQFTKFLHLLQNRFRQFSAPLFRLDGATDNRQEVIDRFQSCTGSAILLMSLKAGGVGLNITAADVVILLDPWWNEAVEKQAVDRAHRIGRVGEVIVLRLVTLGTVEERVEDLKEQKSLLANTFLEDLSSTKKPSPLLFDLLKAL